MYPEKVCLKNGQNFARERNRGENIPGMGLFHVVAQTSDSIW